MTRRCLLAPIVEHHHAADLLGQAAAAWLAGDAARCAALIKEADFEALASFSQRVTGSIDPEIHRQRARPRAASAPTVSGDRMPSGSTTLEVFRRDGWRCRFCDVRVVSPEARKCFTEAFTAAARWGRVNHEKHAALAALTASIDHVQPFSRGGTSLFENLVTACGPCQFGRGEWLLSEVEVEDPRTRPPIVDSWDGLVRVVGVNRARRRSSM